MKKILIAFMVLLVLTACSSQQTSSQEKAKESYTIMVKAANENRNLTADEKKIVEKYDKSNISLDDNDKLASSIHAMYFNFYETLSGESKHFDDAKKTAEKYLK